MLYNFTSGHTNPVDSGRAHLGHWSSAWLCDHRPLGFCGVGPLVSSFTSCRTALLSESPNLVQSPSLEGAFVVCFGLLKSTRFRLEPGSKKSNSTSQGLVPGRLILFFSDYMTKYQRLAESCALQGHIALL